jgi:hypothetical protein
LTFQLIQRLAAFAIAAACLLMPIPAQAGDGHMPQPIPADHLAAAAKAQLTAAERADPLAAMRSIRRFAYRNILFSGLGDGQINQEVLEQGGDLKSALAIVDRRKEGLWCLGTAVVLAHLYNELGFEAYPFSWGENSTLAHAEVLVKVGSNWYLQDAYFNFDYADETGRPLPYREVVEGFRDGRPPVVRQDYDERIGLFANLKNAIEYVPTSHQRQVDCEPDGSRMRCDVTMTLARFGESWSRRRAAEAALEGFGLPSDRLDYFVLFPKWFSKRGAGFNSIDDAELQKVRAITGCWATDAQLYCDETRRPRLANSPPPARRPLKGSWTSLVKDYVLAGSEPIDLRTPAEAWNYGAGSRRLSVREPTLIEMQVEVTQGVVGVSLAKPDGTALLSAEQVVKPLGGPSLVVLEAKPEMDEFIILLRNYDDAGREGRIAVRSAEWVRPVAASEPIQKASR